MSDPLLEERLGGAPGYDELGLSPSDRDKLSYLIGIDMKLAREYLEKHFGATFEQIDREIEGTKRYEARVEKMTEALSRFQLHFPLWLNSERNQATILRFLKDKGLKEFNYRVLAAMYEELAGVDGALDLDETQSPSNPYYVGQINPASGFDNEWSPRKRVDQMSAEEFSNAIARSAKFRARIDGE
jgi:hypothetical protein